MFINQNRGITLKLIDNMDTAFEKIGMEWQYILYSWSYPYRYKAGRSRRFNARISDIQRTMSVDAGKNVHVGLAIKMPVFFAGKNEKAIHGCALWRSANDMPGSGRTEWSWSLNVYTMILAYLVLYALDWPLWPSLVILVLPFPLDFILITFLLAVIQYAIAGLTIYGIWNTFF